MGGPNDSNVTQTSSNVGPTVQSGITNFDAIQSLVENEERVNNLFRQRGASYEQLTNLPSTTGRTPSGKITDANQYRGPYVTRASPLIMTTESFAAEGRYILFWAGPKSVNWKFPMRAAEQQTRSGTIRHVWKDSSRSSFFDEPEASFTFQAGNIMPVRLNRTESVGDDKVSIEVAALPQGLFDFYEFFELLNEPPILPDGRPNFVMMSYHSLVYPEIFLRGHFKPEGISFTENSGDPAKLEWTATFKVRSTSPPFHSSAQLLASWRASFSGIGGTQV